MRRTPVVLGLLSMIFGGLVAIYSGVGLWLQSAVKDFGKLGSMIPRRPGQPDPAVALEATARAMEDLKPYTYAITGGMIVFSLALIVVGLGLYKRQAWSRPASLLWSALALAFIPFQIFVQTQVVQPRIHEAMMKAYEGTAMAGLQSSMAGMQTSATVLGQIIFYAPFPVILLILMGRSSAKNDLLSA
jgi:hypothetical protein